MAGTKRSARGGAKDKTIKVCHVITRLNIGGPAKQVLYLSNRFTGNGYASSVIRGLEDPGEDTMDWLAEELGILPRALPLMSREISPLNDFFCVLELYRMFKRDRPTIVHTHTAKAGAVGLAPWVILLGGLTFQLDKRMGEGHSDALKEMISGLEEYKARAKEHQGEAQKAYSLERLVGDMDLLYRGLADPGDKKPVSS